MPDAPAVQKVLAEIAERVQRARLIVGQPYGTILTDTLGAELDAALALLRGAMIEPAEPVYAEPVRWVGERRP